MLIVLLFMLLLLFQVNQSFARFVIDILSTLLLFNAYTDHNSQASPTPWAGKTFSEQSELKYGNKSEMGLFRENQSILIHYCKTIREDVAVKFFGAGWTIGKLDAIWASSLRYYKQMQHGDIVSSHPSHFMNEANKRVESMWIHHFVILQFFHRKFREHDTINFKNSNHSLFIKMMDDSESRAYTSSYNKQPNFKYLWKRSWWKTE